MCRRSRARGIVETCVCDRYSRNPTQHRQKIEILDEGISKRYEKEYCAHIYVYIYILSKLDSTKLLTSKNKIKRTTVPPSPILSKLSQPQPHTQ